MLLAPEYDSGVQARIPAALCVIHNFIRQSDPSEGRLPSDLDSSRARGEEDEDDNDADRLNTSHDGHDTRRDNIAAEMWDDYQRVLQERGMVDEEDEDDDEEVEVIKRSR